MFKNDWYRYRYDDDEYYQPKRHQDQKFNTAIFTENTKLLSYKDSLIFNANEISNSFNNKKFALMLSGGLDSDVMFRASLEADLDFTTYIFRFENDTNIYDVSYAITLCESHGAKYKLVDLNVTKFYETEAIKFAHLAQTDRPRALPQLKFLDYIDEEFFVLGQGDINWKRLNDINYDEKGDWVHSCNEHEIAWEKYIRATNKKGVPLWFKYTPELQLSTALTNWSQDLLNDRIYGKTGTNTSKILGYREGYPDLTMRIKKTGLEDFLPIVSEIEDELSKLNNGLVNRQSFLRPASEYIELLRGRNTDNK